MTQQQIINYGIMGAAQIAPRFLAGLRAAGGAQALAIGASQLTRAQQFAQVNNIPHAYGSYTELVNDPTLDVIYIPLYNGGHYAGAKLALNHGKSVLLEKPFTLTRAQAEALFTLAQQQHVTLMAAQKAVFLPLTRKIKQILTAGTIGQVSWIDAQSYHPGGTDISWFQDIAAGGGAFRGSAAYPLDYIQYLLNQQFTSYSGECQRQAPAADWQSNVVLKTEQNVLVNLFISAKLPLNSRMIIYGDRGKIVIPNYWKSAEATLYTYDGKATPLRVTQDSEFVFEIQHFNQLWRQHQLTSPIMTPELTCHTIEIIENIYRRWTAGPTAS
ncbi:Gfo/Idh/MocA family protein [Loigolactobacillus zhaoyuanensis]|uniref:Gfo/Idh/MocA family protein n=1 Tax=Loigolactobacillus zhaoyuanensis TaxID=2486017 RepID=A0ABW8UCI9_9LACO|nr:Gfo/Idh/MocA family oxidoreductase [Loigolactobacillus zhaoyuanensis]